MSADDSLPDDVETRKRELYGQRSECRARLLEQRELETAAAEDAIAAE